VLTTSAGTRPDHFGPTEWLLVAVISVTWGSSYMWIALGLESFAPGLIAWLRLTIGAAVLLLLPRQRVAIERHHWRGILLIAIAGNAGPALLFAMAEQTIESSVAGMLTAATPLATLAIALLLGNRTLRPIHIVGLLLGLVGVLMMSAESVVGADAGVAGVVYVIIALLGYAVTSNVTGPLAERYGAVAVVVRSQAIAIVLVTPSGLFALDDSTFSWKSLIAIAILGIFGTGLARALQAMLISRSGAPRASIIGYLVPVVAAILGVAFLGENLSIAEVAGLATITIGALLGSRRISVGRAENADIDRETGPY
jgi:drug/metabolite transporter (DMT)-like permease